VEGSVFVGEVLVFNPEDLASLDVQVPATSETERITSGRSIERFGNRRSPVNDQRLAFWPRHGKATDVETVGLSGNGIFGHINATEAQRLVANIELFQAGERTPHHDVALGPALERSASTEVHHRVTESFGFFPHCLQTRVGVVEEGLFFFNSMPVRHADPPEP
jgi:hypothetical protein